MLHDHRQKPNIAILISTTEVSIIIYLAIYGRKLLCLILWIFSRSNDGKHGNSACKQ